MTLEYLNEEKEKYQKKQIYFQNIGFDNLASDFHGIVDLIKEMENHLIENTIQNDQGEENGKD